MTRIVKKYNENADAIFDRVRSACNKLGHQITKEDTITRSLQASTGLSALSWGETLKIIVTQQRDGSTIVVDFKPRVWFNITAENRAERNARNLVEELEKASKEIN